MNARLIIAYSLMAAMDIAAIAFAAYLRHNTHDRRIARQRRRERDAWGIVPNVSYPASTANRECTA
ncbi:MAG: hypothetical protein EON58_21000 [Alphaproteobacteria bacterium]|nr:MAG: hypothetical protein EON58_21000 [Alphaproteobacteria bacterium]